MVISLEEQGRKFITTEPLSKSTEVGEQIVWDAVRGAFTERDCIGYWRYPIFAKFGEIRKEPDILIIDRELGVIVIEVRSIKIEQIVAVEGEKWELKDFQFPQISPYQLAENQLYALLGYCDRELEIRRNVSAKVMIALPLITAEEWLKQGFDKSPNCPPILFKEQLIKTNLIATIKQVPLVVNGVALDDQKWELLLSVISGHSVLRQPPRLINPEKGKSRSTVLSILQEKLYELDIQKNILAKKFRLVFKECGELLVQEKQFYSVKKQ